MSEPVWKVKFSPQPPDPRAKPVVPFAQRNRPDSVPEEDEDDE